MRSAQRAGSSDATGGWTVPEMLVALCLWGVVVALAAAASVSGLRRSVRQLSWLRLMDAVRTTDDALGSDLRLMAPSRDVDAWGGDSLALRVVRGGGVICRVEGDSVWVWYRGLRAPDPAKDSLLLLGPGGENAVGLDAARTSTDDRCIPRAGHQLLRLTAPGADAGVALIYERGSYHVSRGALRYRRGRSGRQPLTDSVFDPASTFRLLDGSGAPAAGAADARMVEAVLRPTAGPATLTAGPSVARLRLSLLNAGAGP
jgi:type II secretory pathway component PulJ